MNGYKNQEYGKKEQRRKITKQEIVNYLYKCVPEELQNQKCIFYPKTNEISIERHLYHFYIKNGRIIITEKKVRQGKVYDVILNPEKKKAKSKKLTSKKGKVQRSHTLFIYGAVLLLAAYGMKYLIDEDTKGISNETNIAYETQVSSVDLFETREEENIINVETYPDAEQTPENDLIELQVNTIPTDNFGFQKRNRIIEKYGPQIALLTNRYGLDFNFVVDLFSQESHNELDRVSEKEKANMGQLTSVICTEPIVTPVFQNETVVGYEGYFILPSDYPQNVVVNTLSDIDESFLTDLQKDNLRRANRCENCRWQVLRKEEVFYEANTNIQVSIAYLSYLVNKREDLILGAMSYHAGYSKTNGLTREQVVMGSVEAPDANYIANIIRYEPIESYEDGFVFTIQLQNGEKKNYHIKNETLESEYNYEKENGYHL